MARRSAKPAPERPPDRELLENILAIPGSTGETYRRFHNYSTRNLGFLALQGCPPEPVATYKKWADLGYHVKKGEKAFSILRPITVKIRDDEEPDNDEKERMVQRFKVVRALFHYSQVAGDGELPPYEPPEWSQERVLDSLGIERVPFDSYNGNMGGYAVGRTIAINPVAPNPLRTFAHEVSHVELGHTTPDELAEYQQHRGVKEAEAELTGHITLKEIDALDDQTREVSAAYARHWLKDDELSDESVRKILTTSTRVVGAGYELSTGSEQAA